MTSAIHETQLEPRLVGDISGTFFVPAYQRGYRWGETEVRRLLDDIWESRDEPYYLQPVVVKPHGTEWELVDGQQRLTTLFLIMQYMKREGLQNAGASYSIRYETRAGSAAYLNELDADRCQDNIDYFHMFAAYRCISEWFEAQGGRRQYAANKFYGALFEHVRVIWYEAPDDVDASTLFTRLNVGRIPLTDAELVKALLLTRCRGDDTESDRAHEVAAQWDTIERDLRQPELWAFITGDRTRPPTHISLLLDTIAGGPAGRERPQFHTFETLRDMITNSPLPFWEQVVDLHSSVLGWFEDRSLFHKIGFLVSSGRSFGNLIKASKGKRKSQFEAHLDRLIRAELMLAEPDLRELGYSSAKTSKVLLLMNVETIRRRPHSAERYSFREHAAGGWSLEHIHAQNAEPLNTAEQWDTWLSLHRKALVALDLAQGDARDGLVARIDAVRAKLPVREADFRVLETEIVELLSPAAGAVDGGMDSIANLALLARTDNSALSNSVFAVKRAEVLRRDRNGSYIPVCTRQVFLKYYTPADSHQMYLWSDDDRDHYLAAMTEILRPYLLHEVTA